MSGKVFLVGAGPGDPGLITLRGRAVLEQAEAVLYDHLASVKLLEFAPPSAECIYVGKKKTEHVHSQDEICGMMIERARRGLRVVRLKGGDPYIFGRGGEEAEALADAGIPFEVVPGVTAGVGVAAYAGVPLTHREHTSAVTFVTGHDPERIDWEKVGQAETLVIFMGLTTLSRIAAGIIAHGRSPDTPALAVRWAARPDQQTIAGTLATLPKLVAESGLKPPATIVVGEVVRLRGKLNWYERLPLFGQRVAVTRARGQADALAQRLGALAANVIDLAAIEIRPAADYGALDRAVAQLETYDWVVFTSVNGVRFFLDRLDRSKRDLRSLRARLCAIGPATRRALEDLHLKVDLTGKEYVAESLLEALGEHDLAGRRVLLPRAAVARDLLPSELARKGAQVDVVEAYRTVAPEGLGELARQVFSGPCKPHWVTFTSSSTAQNLVREAGAEALRGVKIASIGPVTSATLRGLGVEVTVEAGVYTVDGLVEAITGLSGFPKV
ncbi:MAG: uroporphyrinogen-III C-methyltransferase [Bryobacterales bacterium]|nr:uroporphyrinogen-III C-methyltransferase [Bryobacterales bacterium]